MESYREPGSAHRHVVIVGGGMAGTRLAQQLAGRAVSAGPLDVTVIGEEPHPAYNRVLLAEVLAGRYAPEVIALPAPAAGVRRLGGVRAVRVDRHTAEVLCDDGRRVPYDALVLATGSNPVLPPLRGLFEPDGHDLPDGVHAFRTMDDCLALGAAVRPGARAVVIGGGLLGVSAARALAQRGAQVVLAHQGEHLMERQLDPAASRLLRRHMAALGVEIHTECRVRGLRTRSADGGGGRDRGGAVDAGGGVDVGGGGGGVDGVDGVDVGGAGGGVDGRDGGDGRDRADGRDRGGRAARAVSAVELADGYALEADLVVLACGVRPRVGLARAAGLEVTRGIVIDDELRTSDPRVFAIGDCAEHDGVVYGLAGAAQEQADVLAQVLSPTPPLPETGGLRPPAPHRGSAPDPSRGSAPTTARGSAPGPRAGSAHDTHRSPASGPRPSPAHDAHWDSAPGPRPGSAADANRGAAPGPRSGSAHDAHRDPDPGPDRGTAPEPCQGCAPDAHQGSAPEPHQATALDPHQATAQDTSRGSAPTPARGSAPGPRAGSAHNTHQVTAPGPHPGSTHEAHRGPAPDPHRGSAPGSQDGWGVEPRQGSVPGAAGAGRFAGNRSTEGAPPSGSWGRNGWAQTGHRTAPGNETSAHYTDPAPTTHRTAPGNETSPRHANPAPGDEAPPRYRGTRTLTRLTLTAAPGSALAAATAAPDGHSTPGPLDLAAFGNPTPAPGDDVIHLTDATRNTYRKVVVRGDRLLGGILLGDLGTVGALARTWESDEPLPATPLLHLLTNDGGS